MKREQRKAERETRAETLSQGKGSSSSSFAPGGGHIASNLVNGLWHLGIDTVAKKFTLFSVMGFEMHLIRCWFGLDVGHWTQSYMVWQHV